MVKRKWLWGKKSSEKIGDETESSGSDKFSEDQEPLQGSPSNTQSQEINSKAIESEMNGEETNNREPSLTQILAEAPGIVGSNNSLSKENTSNMSLNEDSRQLLDASMEDSSKSSFSKENASTIFVEDTQGVKVAPQPNIIYVEDNESLKLLTEKLSAALVNVSLKDDMVKQHSRVAEEAVAGWEKAEKEAATLKQQLETLVQKNSVLEARESHLDEALKECVRQLRLARDDQERKIKEAVAEKTNELEIAKTRLEDQVVELQALVEASRINSPDPKLQHKIDFLEKENIVLRQELHSLSEELEVRTIETDLSTKAAETASKQHLESIRKVARLEAECRKLKSLSRVSSLSNERKSTAAPSCAESLTDSQSDGAEQLSTSECDSRKMNGSWASALIAELHQFKSEKAMDKNTHALSMDINLMDDFLEMERLAALPEGGPQVHSIGCDETPEKPVYEADSRLRIELESMASRTAELEEIICKLEAEKAELAMTLAQAQSCFEESQVQLIETQMKMEQLERELRGAYEGELFFKAARDQYAAEATLMISQTKSLKAELGREQALSEQKSARCAELEIELKKREEELKLKQDEMSNHELKMKETTLAHTQDSLEKSETQLKQAELKLKELEKELQEANEEKSSLNFELGSVRLELQTVSSQIESLNEQVQKEQAMVEELSTKSKELEYELHRKTLEFEAQQRAHNNSELKIKQEDLAVAAGKLADCQQTIASLGNQLKSLATLEDFLIDTASIPGVSPPDTLKARCSDEPWKLHLNDTFLSEKEYEPLGNVQDDSSPFASHIKGDNRGSPPPPSSSSKTSSAFFLNYPGSEKNGNGFANYFSLSRG